MTYTRKIYGFCVAVLCTFFMIGCSAVKETSDIAFELDLSTIFSADSGARQVFDGKDNIILNISASICKAKDNSQTDGHGDFLKNVNEEIFYPATKTTKIEFKDLEIGEKYSVYVDISTVEEGDEQPTSVFKGNTEFEVKAGTNVVSLTMEKKTDYAVKLSVNVRDLDIPVLDDNVCYSYILFKVTDHSNNDKEWFSFKKIDKETDKVSNSFNSYFIMQKTSIQAFYVISKTEIQSGNISSHTYSYSILKQSEELLYYVVPGKEVNLDLNDIINVSQSLGTSGLALPVINATNEVSCTIEGATADAPAKITINTTTTESPSVTFTASSNDGVSYAWFLNGNVVVDNSGNSITKGYIGVTLSGNNDIQKTDDPLEPKINTLMLIVSKDSEMQSAIWQFTVVEE